MFTYVFPAARLLRKAPHVKGLVPGAALNKEEGVTSPRNTMEATNFMAGSSMGRAPFRLLLPPLGSPGHKRTMGGPLVLLFP